MISDRAAAELQGIVGADNVLRCEEDLLLYGYDASLDHGIPDLVVFPGSAEEVRDVVRIAHQHGIPVTARGAGTNLSGGSVPVDGGLVLATTRLTRILEIDLENRCAVVEPGVFNLALQRALAPAGLASERRAHRRKRSTTAAPSPPGRRRRKFGFSRRAPSTRSRSVSPSAQVSR